MRRKAGPRHLSDRQAVRQRGRPARRGDAERLFGRCDAGRTLRPRAVERLQRRSRHRRPLPVRRGRRPDSRRRSAARSPLVVRPSGQRRDAGPARSGGRAGLPWQRQRLRLRPRRAFRVRPLVLRRRDAGRLRRERRDGARHRPGRPSTSATGARIVHAVDAGSGVPFVAGPRGTTTRWPRSPDRPCSSPAAGASTCRWGRGRKAPRSRTGSTSAALRRAPWWPSTPPPVPEIWKTYTIPERPRPVRENWLGVQQYGPAGAGVWSAPILDMERRAVYVGTANGYIKRARRRVERRGDRLRPRHRRAALVLPAPRRRPELRGDQHVGRGGQPGVPRLRRAAPTTTCRDHPSWSPCRDGRDVLLAGQESSRITALDPDSETAPFCGSPRRRMPRQAPRARAWARRATGPCTTAPWRSRTGPAAWPRCARTPASAVWYTTHPKPDDCPDPEALRPAPSGVFGAATVIPARGLRRRPGRDAPRLRDP